MTKALMGPIAVLGAGSWGTAVAMHMAHLGQDVRLWGRDEKRMAHMAASQENERYLPGIPLPQSMMVTSDMAAACAGVEDICVMVPSRAFAESLDQLKACGCQPRTMTWGTKGLCTVAPLTYVHELVIDKMGEDCQHGMLSGPTFAGELARGVPTALVVASASSDVLAMYHARLHSEALRCYSSTDLVGVELCGALKNVLAVASGISDGLGLGANARSALITRGLAEMIRLGVALGAHAETFMGLAGVGDVVLSCTSDQSRNRRLGLGLGKGQSLPDVISSIGQVVESVSNVARVHALATSHDVDMPVVSEVYAVLVDHKTPQAALKSLLSRGVSS